EPPIPASLNGEVVGPVPTFIHKTDQERVQNIDLEKYKGLYEVTEKIDGTSATFYFNDGKFGVCGRNWEYKPTADNIYWKIAKQFDLERKMVEKGLNVAIQGEIFGEGINGNPLKIKGQRLLVFDAWDIGKSRYLFYKERGVLIRGLGLEMVPVVFFKNIIDCIEPAWGTLTVVMDVLPLANGSSKINPGARREGLVFKHVSVPNTSFKVVSNEYLLKTDS
nr:RNA ligase family protein [Candidatus Sigynarchaeota archaeon]